MQLLCDDGIHVWGLSSRKRAMNRGSGRGSGAPRSAQCPFSFLIAEGVHSADCLQSLLPGATG